MKDEFLKSFFPYFNSFRLKSQTFELDVLIMADPAAVSHSIVFPFLKYKSASPSATKQNLIDEPTLSVECSFVIFFSKLIVKLSR